MSFDAVVKKQGKHGKWKPKQVANFDFEDLPVTCDDGPHLLSFSTGTSNPPLRVQNGAFAYQFTEFVANLEGALTKKGKRATGQVDYGPEDVSSVTNCSTGILSWSAQKTGTHPTLPRR